MNKYKNLAEFVIKYLYKVESLEHSHTEIGFSINNDRSHGSGLDSFLLDGFTFSKVLPMKTGGGELFVENKRFIFKIE